MGDQPKEHDPFLIDLSWTAVPNASVYIVEFYPLNRQPRAGENNFFRAMTTSLMYTVRKEDECIEYDARVIAVNSYGISIPSYTHIQAPSPRMSAPNHFTIRKMQRDPWSPDMVAVTIDYTFPRGWPVDDIDLDFIQVNASDCQGPLGQRTFGTFSQTRNMLIPSYNALIGKTPTTAIQLQFFDDVLQSNCLFHMQVSSLSTRCNTTTNYDPSSTAMVPGVDFRINCDSVKGACDNDNSSESSTPPAPMAPIPVPSSAVAADSDDFVAPMNLPPGINQPDEQLNSTDVSTDMDNMPTPPPLPLFLEGNQQFQVVPLAKPMSPGASFSVIDVAPNGSGIQSVPINPQTVIPPLCEVDMLDVQPSTSPLSPSLIDLTVVWLERQPLPPPPPPTYFAIRYGPLIRQLVDDNRQEAEIIPGYETIVHTGQQSQGPPMMPDPTRQISISGTQRSSLLKLQICAIYDPNSEPMIQWDTVPSHRVDLAALEPFLELENTPTIQSIPSVDDIQDALGMAPQTTQTDTGNSNTEAESPLIIQVGVIDTNTSSTMYWMSVMAGLMLIMFTALLVFVCLRRVCNSRRMVKVVKYEKPAVVVHTLPPPPFVNEVVKVPLP